MIMNFDDVHDGAVVGQAVLQVNKAEENTLPSGAPIINVSYLITEAEPQGEKEVDVSGTEFVNHTVFLPQNQDPAGKARMKKKMFMQFLKAHGITPDGNIDTSEAVSVLNNEQPEVQAYLSEDDYAKKNRGIIQTKIARFITPE